ncbi:hypothetical protein RIF29_19306 [Crotalaria pallida]|uniref:WIT1/2 N-terminal helical bundle domain-containing protein n=1 Tax=Crotalaria pallida TaxID=3830 RepID=A0AAN9F1R4_CROPI
MATERVEHHHDVDDDDDAVSVDHEDIIGDLLTGLDLSLAFFSEKVTNLSILVMHLATMECEFEALISDKDRAGFDSIEKCLRFDLLCVVLDSEVGELDLFLDNIQVQIAYCKENVSSCTHFGEAYMAMQHKLLDSEECLKQSEEQFGDIKMQSVTFRRTLCSFKRAENAGHIIREDEKSFDVDAEIKMQTIAQQRRVLSMLEKSLARELELEKNFNDSREIQEILKLRLFSLEQELVHTEDEAIDVWERWFEADNALEILLGISKGLLGRLQVSQFNLNGLSHRESELRAKLETFAEQLKARDITVHQIGSSTAEENSFLSGQTNGAKANELVLANSDVFTLSEKVCSLEEQLKESESQLLNVKASADICQKQYSVVCSEVRDMGNLIVELKENVSNSESRAESAEAKCKLLAESNSNLNKELSLLKDSGNTSARIDSLERQLKESDPRLQNALASPEAIQVKQSMLYSTIRDMENIIKDLKSKVSKAESRADSAEDNCIILSESNAELNEELSFLRGRLECLEGSLHREEEAKMATAKDLEKQTKVLKNLVTQLALERERLKLQNSHIFTGVSSAHHLIWNRIRHSASTWCKVNFASK